MSVRYKWSIVQNMLTGGVGEDELGSFSQAKGGPYAILQPEGTEGHELPHEEEVPEYCPEL